jgi:carbonic anhydrase
MILSGRDEQMRKGDTMHRAFISVVSVLMTEGATDNPVIAKLWAQMPTKMGEKNKLEAEINAVDLLPKSKAYFHYSGSLTTPPCSEGVRWYVMKESITVSKAPIDAFRQRWAMPTTALCSR